MKHLFSCALAAVIFLAACTKSSLNPSPSASSSTADQSVLTRPSNMELLTAHTWMYKAFYVNFVDSMDLGRLVYRVGFTTTNKVDLSNNRLKYNEDGTFMETDSSGNMIPGLWEFGDAEQTIIGMKDTTGQYRRTILFLGPKGFRWKGPINGNETKFEPEYAEMMPEQ